MTDDKGGIELKDKPKVGNMKDEPNKLSIPAELDTSKPNPTTKVK